MITEDWINSLNIDAPSKRGSQCTNLDLAFIMGEITEEQYNWLKKRQQWGWRAKGGYKNDNTNARFTRI